MKYLVNGVVGEDANVTFTLDDGSESTQTISVKSYGGSVQEAVENYGRLYQAELEPVKARKADLVAEAAVLVGKEKTFDVNAVPEAKPIV